MKPEQLKVIAEGMGYKFVEVVLDGVMYNWNIGFDEAREYNPDTTNAEQCMEIMERLLIEHGTIKFEKYKSGDVGMIDNWRNDYALGEGKIINEAVCNAAYECFK